MIHKCPILQTAVNQTRINQIRINQTSQGALQ